MTSLKRQTEYFITKGSAILSLLPIQYTDLIQNKKYTEHEHSHNHFQSSVTLYTVTANVFSNLSNFLGFVSLLSLIIRVTFHTEK